MKIERHSPSSLNLFAACQSMFVLEKIHGRRQSVGTAAHRGSAVEDGVTVGLMNPSATMEECSRVAIATFDRKAALSTDPKREEHRKSIPEMVARAIGELRPYGIPSGTQGFVSWHPPELQYPIVGYYDYIWEQSGIVIDLKTSETLSSKIKPEHARQVALYRAEAGDNLEARLTYCSPKKVATYQLENAGAHLNSLKRIAMTCERFLALSDDPQFFTSITVPDLSSFYWNSDSARQAAWDTWQI